MSSSKKKSKKPKFKVLSYEDTIPIYETEKKAITYLDHPLSSIIKEDVEGVPGAFTLHNVLLPKECDQYIDLTERMGYIFAPITTAFGMVNKPGIRNNKRVMWQTTPDIWEPIWHRIKPYIPDTVSYGTVREWKSCSLNERFRFYRYEEGEIFNRHFDGDFSRDSRNVSFLTIIIYLSDSFEGGETTFYCSKQETKVKPVKGSALVFWHGRHKLSPMHEGSMCKGGIKYVLRSDVMFRW
eukprot:TRINITY_DN3811_c0_g1_i1.p1 TRINITY_DN3811_c0_g1~~TRINITY_DN3811_c0_g1_i1.p1  ORF type:complete len:256 (-),score=38.51 TRINITY_DN3811_c0_g1_i1:37-753(-)